MSAHWELAPSLFPSNRTCNAQQPAPCRAHLGCTLHAAGTTPPGSPALTLSRALLPPCASVQVVGAVGFQNKSLPPPTEGDPFLISLCLRCLATNPRSRPLFPQIVQVRPPLGGSGLLRLLGCWVDLHSAHWAPSRCHATQHAAGMLNLGSNLC